MATNNFKPFAIASGANVTAQADYEALTALASGFQAGKASSAQVNKAIRQATVMAYVLAQFISDSAAVDVLDNGVPATILASLKSSMTALTPGRLLNVQVFSASGVYIPTSGTKKIIVEVQGAGGGGGSASASSTSTASVATGGGAGAYAKSILTTVPASQAVVVGTGGTAGIAGGYSSFGTIVASGGAAGGNNLSSSWSSGVILSRGAQTANATGGNLINSIGGAGGDAIYSNMGNCLSGAGGDSFLSEGAFKIGGGSGNGAAAVLGAGGSGANATQTTTTMVGGKGGDGVVYVWEYA